MKPTHQTIAIVDDDSHFTEILHEILSAESYQVYTYQNLQQLTQAEIKPSIILLDLWLGHHSSHTFAPDLKNKFTDAAIIMMSSDHNVSQIAPQIPAKKYLIKPFPISHLLEALKT